jgi:two-component system, response regulator PdtaR
LAFTPQASGFPKARHAQSKAFGTWLSLPLAVVGSPPGQRRQRGVSGDRHGAFHTQCNQQLTNRGMTMTAPQTGKTLMIVEDEALVAMELRDVLEEAGYHVLDLTDRRADALEVAKACKPDLALVNIRLAGRDDGIELAERLKTLGIPVVFISGQSGRARSAQTVAIASLPKPYNSADMVIAVAYLLRRLEGDDSLPRPARLEVFDDSGFGLAPAV